MDETLNLYFALITAIGSVLMLAFGWIFWTNGTMTKMLRKMTIGKHKYFGKDWTNKIYFNREADKSKTFDSVNGRQLMTVLLDLVGEDEDIKTVTLYKCRLSLRQWTMAYFYHKFVIFETKDGFGKWFWSIEKKTDAIIILRSRDESYVKDKTIKQDDRLPNVVQLKSSARGRTSVYDLIKWLCDEHELYNQYHAPTTNCQIFADAVFDKVAMSWCYVIEFITDTGETHFDDSELMTELVSLVDVNEVILNVFLYEDPTYYGSRWSCVFETNAWWWSIENRQEIMIITRNKEESNVEQYLNTDIKKRKSARGTTSMHDLINWLYNKKELKRLHIYIMLSTKTFANDVFGYVSRMNDNQKVQCQHK